MNRVIMGANIGGIYGAQLFRQDDRPHYRRGFSIACAIVALGVACAVLRFVLGERRQKHQQHQHQHQQQQHQDNEGGMRLSSDEVRNHGHGPVATRVVTGDMPSSGAHNNDAETDVHTDETLVGTMASYEKAEKENGQAIDETLPRKSDVVVREGGELRVVDGADAYQSLEMEIGIAR
jgi:hypothetical protein